LKSLWRKLSLERKQKKIKEKVKVKPAEEEKEKLTTLEEIIATIDFIEESYSLGYWNWELQLCRNL